MEFIFAFCRSDAQLKGIRAAWRGKKITRNAYFKYVLVHSRPIDDWGKLYDEKLKALSLTGPKEHLLVGEGLLVRFDRNGQFELRLYRNGVLARDLFYSNEAWRRVGGGPELWEEKVLGAEVGKPGDAEPSCFYAAEVFEALRVTLDCPEVRYP